MSGERNSAKQIYTSWCSNALGSKWLIWVQCSAHGRFPQSDLCDSNQSLLSGQAVRLSKVHSSEQVTPPAVDEHILFIHSVLAHPGAMEVGGHERRCSKILSKGGIPKKVKTVTFASTCKICFAFDFSSILTAF